MKRWRLNRAAIYGAIAGFVLTAIGVMGAPPAPPQSGAEQLSYVAGQWLGIPIVSTLLFLIVASVRNLLPRMFSNSPTTE